MPQEEKPFDLTTATPREREAYQAGYDAALKLTEMLGGRDQLPAGNRPEILNYVFDQQGRLGPVLAGQGITTLEQLRNTPDKELFFLTPEEISLVRQVADDPDCSVRSN